MFVEQVSEKHIHTLFLVVGYLTCKITSGTEYSYLVYRYFYLSLIF